MFDVYPPLHAGIPSGFLVEYKGKLLHTRCPVRLLKDEGEDSSVTVAVRVRPFSERFVISCVA